jgi:Zn-dependent protease/CBS domain-containing protein
MRQTVGLGRIAGIQVGAHWSVLVIMVLLAQGLAFSILPASAPGLPTVVYWVVAVVVAALFLGALLAHELSHALVARHYGVRSRRITLWLLGGVTELEGEAPHARGDLLIAIVGPVTSLAVGGFFGVAAIITSAIGLPRLAVAALSWLALVNLILAVFNLLPGAPLDGGRVLRAAVWWIRGDRGQAQRVASRAGVVLGMLLIIAGVVEVLLIRNLGGLWLALLGWFLTSAARAEGVDTGLRTTLGSVRVGDVMTTPAVYGSANQTVDNFITSVARHSPHPAYPVVDPEGRLAGMVTLSGLAQVAAPERPTVRLDAVQEPLSQVTVLDAAAPLAETATQLLTNGHRLAAVVTDDRLVGVLTTGDVNRSIELASLQVPPDRKPPPPPEQESAQWRG